MKNIAESVPSTIQASLFILSNAKESRKSGFFLIRNFKNFNFLVVVY